MTRNLMYTLLTMICGLMLQVSMLSAQSPYKLSSGTDLPILGGETALFGINLKLRKKFPVLKPQDTLGLDMFKLPGLDQPVVYNWDTSAQRTSDILLRTSPLVPLALPLLAGGNGHHRMGVTYTMVFEGMLATYTITELTKLLAKRKRPYVYGRSAFDGNLYDKNAQKSFFSGHSSYTAVNYYMGAKMFHDFYPDSKWKPAVWATAAVIPAITAWKRVQGGKHFVTDVVVGYLVGGLVGILIPELHRK